MMAISQLCAFTTIIYIYIEFDTSVIAISPLREATGRIAVNIGRAAEDAAGWPRRAGALKLALRAIIYRLYAIMLPLSPPFATLRATQPAGHARFQRCTFRFRRITP